MGIDLGTYRCRIGTFAHNKGNDVVSVKVYVYFSDLLKTVGSVTFIGLLLLLAGIEPNPGPDVFFTIITVVVCIISLIILLDRLGYVQTQRGRDDICQNTRTKGKDKDSEGKNRLRDKSIPERQVSSTKDTPLKKRADVVDNKSIPESQVSSTKDIHLKKRADVVDIKSKPESQISSTEDASLEKRADVVNYKSIPESQISSTEDTPLKRYEDVADIKSKPESRDSSTEDARLQKRADVVDISPERKHEVTEAWNEMIKALGLCSNPLSFNDVMEIADEQKRKLELSDIPKEMLSRLIMIDYKARDHLPDKVLQQFISIKNENNPFEDDDDENSPQYIFNIQDIFITIFNACDSFLKQIIVNKMIICRLAVPLIYHCLPHQIPCFSIWPLRTTTFEVKGSNATEISLVRSRMKIISFLRYSRLGVVSKSKLLNDILSDESHPTFYHRDCPLGMNERKIANGLIEASWYIPAGKESDFFNDVSMFVNLRGNAEMFKKQSDVLTNISNVIIVFIDIEDLQTHLDNIKDVTLVSQTVVLVLTSKFSSTCSVQKQQDITRLIKSNIQNINTVYAFRKNASQLTKDLRKGILSLCNSEGLSIEMCAEAASEINISSDEESKTCKESKRVAQNILNHLPSNKGTKIKELVLPLQGSLWKDWSNIYKKLKKPGKTTVNESNESLVKMKTLREKQAEKAKTISPFLKDFITTLIVFSYDQNFTSYFLHWIKFFLDERSRAIIPPLTLEYHTSWKTFKKTKDKLKEKGKFEDRQKHTCLRSECQSLKLEMEKAEQALTDASLGFEHIIRELGQLYEAALECNIMNDLDIKDFDSLPSVISRLLLLGFPIELMDGDVANVPCKWLKAVFDSLTKVIGNVKVLTLSILGVQSSGKSTFLNTMFGLQFAVSAGRCTKGIYMQLVPVKHFSSQTLGFDYIIVLDTEGIRAPELGLQKHDHDNELATLVIGMGDVTIINIKGENTADINDVLQIAVHAFLRLKSANDKLDLKQSCTFVHQNVPAMNAKTKMQQGRQKLVQNLDDMTVVAAEQENMKNITTFDQVIKFNSQENVWYLSDLWHGDPPMSHANPGYSNSVRKVKEYIIFTTGKSRTTFFTLTDTANCIVDLWNGILADDFVFSFRNSIEMKVHSTMETEYQKISWELEEYMAKQVQKMSSIFDGNGSPDDICRKFELKIRKQNLQSIEKLEDYFKNNEYSEILIQWKASKINLLESFTIDEIEKSKRDLRNRHEFKRVGKETDSIITRCVEEIADMAQALARDFKGKAPSSDELKTAFEKMWSQWYRALSTDTQEIKIDICTEVEIILFERYQHLQNMIQIEVNKKKLSDWDSKKSLFDQLNDSVSKNENHIRYKHMTDRLLNAFTKPQKEVKNFLEELNVKITTIFDSFKKVDTKFEKAHVRNMLNQVDEQFSSHEKDSTKQFCFLPKFRAIVLVHVCCFIVHEFESIQKQYETTHCIKAKIAECRQVTWKLFENTVLEKSNEVIAADLFCDSISSCLRKILNEKISLSIKSKILTMFEHSKHRLMVEIMDDLALKDDFTIFCQYIVDPKTYSLKWISDYIQEFAFTKSKETSTTVYADLAEKHIETLVNKIKKELANAAKDDMESEDKKMERLITYLVQNCEYFQIEEGYRKRLSRYLFPHLKGFLDTTLAYLDDMKERIYLSAKDVSTFTWEQPIQDEILERLWGCEDKCPFCLEPCHWSKGHDGKHRCVQHRPTGIRSMHRVTTKVLCTNSCSFAVYSTGNFYCFTVGDKCKLPNCPKTEETLHAYKDYHSVLPDWEITPSSDMSQSKYWNWFFAKYVDDIAKYYDLIKPDIPSTWKSITKHEAQESLRDVYG